ncbi:hypothetical protein AOCH_006649 [Aspergillus ochraceoroseus]|uniref:DUF7703 domain-containing protein n=1 Tax=Aspergillus ochraceoroseus TaxID=138278 RepID=A0A0F8XKA0_9EURO|nr:hypothetical protein AOCH_006649 [Aspergillus ochraceoroseus]
MGELTHPPDGLIGGYQGNSVAVKILMVVFSSLALYNAVELVILILFTFNRYHGLYFWTMLLSSVLGVIPHAIGYIMEFFALGPIWLAVSISTVGFYFMVPGQSVVLYSRLHLVVQNRKLLRAVLYIIIIDTVILLVPTTILTYSTVYIRTTTIIIGYNVMERLQVVWFCAQEIMISSIYIWETAKLLRLMPEKDTHRTRVLYELLTINMVIIILDVALLVLEFLGLWYLQTTLKALVYSIKLKLECAVLRKLVSVVNNHPRDTSSSEQEQFPNFVNPEQIVGDVTHAPAMTRQTLARYPWSGALSMDSLTLSEQRSRSQSSASSQPP